MRSDRGVSVTLDYVLMLGIGTVLLASVIVASGAVIDGQLDRGIDAELEVTGQALAADLDQVDRVGTASATGTTIAITTDLPYTVSDTSYSIVLDPGEEELRLVSRQPERTISIAVPAVGSVEEETTLSGGPARIEYADGTIRVMEA